MSYSEIFVMKSEVADVLLLILEASCVVTSIVILTQGCNWPKWHFRES